MAAASSRDRSVRRPAPASSPKPRAGGGSSSGPVKLLIITGDHGHDWKETTPALKEILSAGGKINVDVTTTPAKDLTDENLAKYDVLLLELQGHAQGSARNEVVRREQGGVSEGRVRDGKGLVVFHLASSAFVKPELGRVREGDRRRLAIAGVPRAEARFQREEDRGQAPDLRGPARPSSTHTIDELYQNSVMVPGNEVLATAYSDPNKPRGTGKDEPVIWVNNYGKGRVYNNAPGPRHRGHVRPQLPGLDAPGRDLGGNGKG